MIRILSITIVLLITANIFAQKQKDWIELGNQAYDMGDFYGSKHYYENALEMDSSKAPIQYKYAEILRNINDYEAAEKMYYKVFRKERGQFYPKGIYWIAKMNEYKGDYEKAIEFWKKCQERLDDVDKKWLSQRIKSCNWAIANKDKMEEKEIINAGRKINSAESEFGMVSLDDSLFFFSSLRGDYNDKDVLLQPIYDIQIYRSAKKGENKFTRSREITDTVNLANYINANGCFNTDRSLFFFSRCDVDRRCEIMVADYNNEVISNVRRLSQEVNIPNASATQPQVTKIGNQEYLFFSSDRTGGKGKRDIWYTKINGDKVETAINAGAIVNSMDNEITPFYDVKESRLYFSSDWHEGLGGFDIFYAEGLPEGNFATPKNLLPPYNTSVNDMYYWRESETRGFLTSNRKGSLTSKGETCCNDIWIFDDPKIDSVIVENRDSTLLGGGSDAQSGEDGSFLPTIESIEDLSKYLPISLYFENDRPNPKTLATRTNLTYSNTYETYWSKRTDFYNNISTSLSSEDKLKVENGLNDFFQNQVKKGKVDLNFFLRLLERELEKGRKIELAIKGYASPLSNSDYNANLTMRRISSLINEMSAWNNGAFTKYINSSNENSGILTFKEIPFGESQAAAGIDDKLENKSKSIYSVAASLERRIEILEVTEK